MSKTAKKHWEERHYESAERSDRMFRINAQGKEIDI